MNITIEVGPHLLSVLWGILAVIGFWAGATIATKIRK